MAGNTLDSARRRFLRALIATPLVFVAGGRLRWLDGLAAAATRQGATEPGAKPVPRLEPTPDCGDDDEPTPEVTQGPFFKPRSPLRRSLLENATGGARIVLTGGVFSGHCRPVAGALLDFWHADADGIYDNVGFKLRGHQFADDKGRYRLETVVPGLYPGRTRHFHVKVQAPHGRILTTQLFFPGEPRNQSDGIFRRDLLMAVSAAENATEVRFRFVLDLD